MAVPASVSDAMGASPVVDNSLCWTAQAPRHRQQAKATHAANRKTLRSLFPDKTRLITAPSLLRSRSLR